MTDWDIGDENIWRLAVLILELPKENSSQPGSKDSRFFTPRVGQKYVIEMHHEPSTNFCVITDDGSSTGLKLHHYVLETEELMSWWNRLTE